MKNAASLNLGGNDVSNSPTFKRLSLGVATVVTAIGALAPAAPAAVVAHAVNVTLDASALTDYALDVNQDGTTDFTIQTAYAPDPTGFLTVGFDQFVFPFGGSNATVIDGENAGFPSVSLLAPGAAISSASTFSSVNDQGNIYSYDTFDGESGNFGDKTGYVGLRFTGTGGTYYGYAQISVLDENAATPFNFTIGTVAYNTTPGAAITAGAVPEPASIGLLAAGAVAMFGRRKSTSTSI